MKNIVKILSLAVLGVAMASCADKPKFNTDSFISMYRPSATVNENASGTLYNIPVKVYHAEGAVSVAYTVSGTAESGVDYTLADQSGVLNFAAGTDSLAIPVTVFGQPGTFTGDRTMRITLTSSTGAEINSRKTFTLTIKDLDHPLVELFGDYTMSAICLNNNGGLSYPAWELEISEYKGDVTKVWLSNVTPFAAAWGDTGDCPVYGTVSSDKKTITITLPQETTGTLKEWGYTDEGNSSAWIYAHEGFKLDADGNLAGLYILADKDIVFTLGEDGSWTTKDSVGLSHPDDVKEYPDLFYYYAVNYSNYNANYPTVFKKK